MNQKLSFQDLASHLSAAASQPSAFSEEFIKELIALVSDALAAGESVKIKGLGEFKPAPGAPDKLTFIPDETLAEKVNAPFSQFEPAALNPTVTDELLNSVEPIDEVEEKADVNDTVVSVSQPVTVTETELSAPDSEEIPVYIPAETAESENETETPQPAVADSIEVVEVSVETPAEIVDTPVTPAPVPEIIPIEEDEEEIFDSKESRSAAVPPPYEPAAASDVVQDKSVETESKSGGFGMGFFVGLIVGIAIGAAAMFFYASSLAPARTPKPVPDEEPATDDVIDITGMPDTAWADLDTVTPTAAVTEPQPAPQPEPEPVAAAPAAPVTDKVKAGYLMPKMAQKHYGNQVFWVYIYEENKTKISNPNNLTAGLELVIPAPEKYGIDANDPASIARAQAKEAEIWNKK
ncbi:MAG: hypothetical protein K2L14_09390 [Duncaniella sp.]|nr:hypothetical protein [Duncaniella sp.]